MDTSSFEIKPFIYLAVLTLVLSFCFDTTQESLRNPAYLFAFVAALIVFALNLKQLKAAEVDPVYVILTLGVLLKLSYVLYTAIWTRQHDVIDFGVGEGHAGYIEYIYLHDALPPGDPREKWAFFQPPLHHIIAAIWMKVCNKCGLAYRQIQENVQALTLFYTASVSILSYYICKELKLKRNGTLVALLLISFHPVFVIMSGSINNDALSLLLTVFALYIVILWYQKPVVWWIVLLALSIGLAMAAKLSGGLIAPAVAVLFILKLVRDKENFVKYILQYLLFGVIVFPLGIGWEIRNMLRYGMPFNYIPPVGEPLSQGMLSRLFDLRLHSVYPAMIANGDKYDEYNVFLAMFKTSLFDDSNFSLKWTLIDPFATVLFITGLLLMLLCFYATGKVLFKRGEGALRLEWKLLLGIFYGTMLIAYFSFALGSANYSAESFRYIAAAVVIEAIFLGIYVDEKCGDSRWSEIKAVKALVILCFLFAGASSLTYILLGFAAIE